MLVADEEEIRPDVRMLPGMIEVAEQAGRWEHAQKLRGWLEEAVAKKRRKKPVVIEPEILLPGDDDYENAEPDETIITTSLPWRAPVRNRLYDREVTDAAQLTRWRIRFLRAIMPADDVWAVEQLCTAIGFPVGSAVELLATLPKKSPFGIDLRDGRRPDDCSSALRRLAYGEITFRQASVELGSRGLSKVPPHQRAGSIIQRHARMFANYRRMALIEQHKQDGWLIDVGPREFPGAKPGHGLWIKVIDEATAIAALRATDGISDKPVYGGISSRGCPIILIGGR